MVSYFYCVRIEAFDSLHYYRTGTGHRGCVASQTSSVGSIIRIFSKAQKAMRGSHQSVAATHVEHPAYGTTSFVRLFLWVMGLTVTPEAGRMSMTLYYGDGTRAEAHQECINYSLTTRIN